MARIDSNFDYFKQAAKIETNNTPPRKEDFDIDFKQKPNGREYSVSTQATTSFICKTISIVVCPH